jgi:hypothetical protein
MADNKVEDEEIAAISEVYAALKDLDGSAQERVLDYVTRKLNISCATRSTAAGSEYHEGALASDSATPVHGSENKSEGKEGEDIDGISPVAHRWMRRNGLRADRLEALFSLGVDEIDLIAKTVPGKTKSKRMRNILLLKGIAAYLGTGAARFTHEQMKEACLHYDAYDGTNFSKHLKNFATEVSGNKESGYTLTARGLSSATELLKKISEANSDEEAQTLP